MMSTITLMMTVSIQLMSPASGDAIAQHEGTLVVDCFHSINVPSEWGQSWNVEMVKKSKVSIQLMSPASGDAKLQTLGMIEIEIHGFPFN